ncbi:AAA family ATPase, partial [Arthrospira platensis SPKY1]|nr:AAA family ATPase [Arthrospira platensis SPKY1]
MRGEVVYPTFSELETTQGKPTDFNDLQVLRGIDAVKEQIERVTKPIAEKLAFEFSRVDSLGLTEIQWIIEGYVEADSLAQVFGDPGCGKSFVAIDMACSIAT